MRSCMLVYFTVQMHWNWLLFKQENKFQGNIFTKVLSSFTSKIGNLIFIFEKVQIKIVNAVICGKKNKCARYGKQTCFCLFVWLFCFCFFCLIYYVWYLHILCFYFVQQVCTHKCELAFALLTSHYYLISTISLLDSVLSIQTTLVLCFPYPKRKWRLPVNGSKASVNAITAILTGCDETIQHYVSMYFTKEGGLPTSVQLECLYACVSRIYVLWCVYVQLWRRHSGGECTSNLPEHHLIVTW